MSAPSSKRFEMLFLDPPLWFTIILFVGLGIGHHTSGNMLPAYGLYVFPIVAGVVTSFATFLNIADHIADDGWKALTARRVLAANVIMLCVTALTFTVTLILYSKVAFVALSVPACHVALRQHRARRPAPPLPVARVKR